MVARCYRERFGAEIRRVFERGKNISGSENAEIFVEDR